MSGCCAYGCKNRSENQTPGITFHLFPKDSIRRKAWTLAVKRKNFRPTNFTRICSEHFAEECFNRSSKKYVRLHPNAVPTIFKNYPKNLQNLSNLAPLTQFYSENDLIIKKSETDSDEEIGEDEEDEEIGEEDEEDEDEDEDSMSESESSEESECEAPPETEVVYVSEEFADTDNPSLKVVPGPGQQPTKDVEMDKDLKDALSAYKKLKGTANPEDLKGKTVSVIFVQPPRDDELPPISPEANLKRLPGGLEYRVWMQTKKIKALNEQNEKYLERIRELEKIIESYKNPQTTDEEDVSEDDISVNEIYEVLLKHQKEKSAAES